MKKEVLGIDISKLTIDVYLHIKQSAEVFDNDPTGFKKLIRWLKREKTDLKTLLVCFEHTGMYSFSLSCFLTEHKIDYVMESPIQIKRSMGLIRGKNDKIDSVRIADYAYRRRDQLSPTNNKVDGRKCPPPKGLRALEGNHVVPSWSRGFCSPLTAPLSPSA